MSDELDRYRVTRETPVSAIDLEREAFVLPDGRHLTEELAAQIGEDASARRRANLVPGRKSLSADGRHSPAVQVRLPAQLLADLRRVAAERHVSVSRVARAAIDQYVTATKTITQNGEGAQLPDLDSNQESAP